MNIRQPSFLRDLIGFVAGGNAAAVCAGLVFVAFVPLGDIRDGRNHAPEAFMLTLLVMFICGGFIGRRGFSAQGRADFYPPIIGRYLTVLGLPLLAGLSLIEALPFAGFATAGVLAAVIASVAFLTWFPIEVSREQG